MDVLTRPAAPPAALHRFGARAQRVAFIGDDPVLGLGTGSSESALPGLVADLLTPRTHRGLDADLFTGPEWSAKAVVQGAGSLRLGRYDAVVVAFSSPSRLLPTRGQRWIRAAFDTLLGSTQADTEIVVLSAAGSDADGRLSRLQEFVEHCRADLERSGRTFALLERPVAPEPDRPTAVASALATRLSTGMPAAGDAWRRRDSADDEGARQQAVESSGVLDVRSDELVQTLLNRARAAFSTPSAALNVIDRDRLWMASTVGGPGGEVPREQTFCNVTIQHSDAFVVRDTWQDDRLAGGTLAADDQPIRFYAGFPIESADGYRIGALCVYDTVPHDASEFDIAVLRDIALTMQDLIQVGALNGQPA